jgi:carbon monoxide dehydrogenase subunit G
MAIPFSGQFTTPATPDEVFDFLSDPGKFGPLLPDFQSMTQEDESHFTVRLSVGVGNLKGTTDIRMERREAAPSQRVLYIGEGNAFGNRITVQIGFDLSPAPESTVVAWQGQADVVGKLAMLAAGMLEPLAGKGMSKLMDGLKNTLAKRAASEMPTPQEPSPTPEDPQAQINRSASSAAAQNSGSDKHALEDSAGTHHS